MGFIEEKKENDSLIGANIHNNGAGSDAEIKKSDDKVKMMDSFDMEENEGGEQNEQQGQHHPDAQQGNTLVDLTGPSLTHQQPQPRLTSINHMTNNGLLDQAAQQLLTQAGIAFDAPALGYLVGQTPNLSQGSLNLLSVQNALVQNHNQAVAHAQASALMGGGGLVAPNTVQPFGNVVSNGFSVGNQLQNQQQLLQQQVLGSSASSLTSTGFPSAFPSIQPNIAANIAALSPTNQMTQAPAALQQLLSAVPFASPSIFGPALPPASLTLTPQLTIPHYIPPTPASWGAPLPTLTVQDRPLVPPIYNGINPNYPKAQMLHAHPPIYCVYDFLTPAECDFLIEAASDAFGPAPVVGKGQGEVSPSRTSSTCYLAREDLPEYLRKISLLTGKPAEHCELPQVGRYLPSQQYLQHFDAFDLSNEDGRRFAQNGGQRTCTVLTYLNDVGVGGATAFPNLNLQVQPRRGMALVFFPSTLDGLLDKMALHAALPAVDIKYVSQVWIRQTNYDGRPSKRLAKPMTAGLQEQRDREILMGLQQLSAIQS
ncbi:hypothetical protein ACHAXN_005737 [Cyclotella atomus]